MARKTRRRTRARKRRTLPKLPSRTTIVRTASVVTMLALGAGAVLGVLLGVPRLEARAEQLQRMEPDRIEPVFHWPAPPGQDTWVPEHVRHQLEGIVYAAVADHPNTFSRAALSRIGAELDATGWFAEIESVRRLSGGKIAIKGIWRRPGAVVRRGGGAGPARDLLISDRAELLPMEFEPDTAALPVIHGVQLNPPRQYGHVWPGDDVLAGVELISLLRRQAWADQVVGVDVAEFSRRRLVILTSHGTWVGWGGPVGASEPGQLDDQARLARLDMLNQRFGRIDAGQQHVEVFWPEILLDESAGAP